MNMVVPSPLGQAHSEQQLWCLSLRIYKVSRTGGVQTYLCYQYANHDKKFHWFHRFKMASLPLSIITTIEVTNFSYQVFLLKSWYTRHLKANPYLQMDYSSLTYKNWNNIFVQTQQAWNSTCRINMMSVCYLTVGFIFSFFFFFRQL